MMWTVWSCGAAGIVQNRAKGWLVKFCFALFEISHHIPHLSDNLQTPTLLQSLIFFHCLFDSERPLWQIGKLRWFFSHRVLLIVATISLAIWHKFWPGSIAWISYNGSLLVALANHTRWHSAIFMYTGPRILFVLVEIQWIRVLENNRSARN